MPPYEENKPRFKGIGFLTMRFLSRVKFISNKNGSL